MRLSTSYRITEAGVIGSTEASTCALHVHCVAALIVRLNPRIHPRRLYTSCMYIKQVVRTFASEQELEGGDAPTSTTRSRLTLTPVSRPYSDPVRRRPASYGFN